MRLSDLQMKEIVNIVDGKRIDKLIDMEIEKRSENSKYERFRSSNK